MQVAWLYNIRGSDVSYSPVVHAFAIVTLNSAFFYVDKRKVSDEVCQANVPCFLSLSNLRESHLDTILYLISVDILFNLSSVFSFKLCFFFL